MDITREIFENKSSSLFCMFRNICVDVFLGCEVLEHVYCLVEGAIKRKSSDERKRRGITGRETL